MNKIVATSFKSIMFAIIFVIVWDVCFYVWRANVLNQRMESIAVSMQDVITKNNYIPKGEENMFKAIMRSIRDDMNTGDTFITSIGWNISTDSIYKPTINGTTVVRHTKDPARYGNVMVLELHVKVNANVWQNDDGNSAEDFKREYKNIEFVYTYLVPCLKFTSVTD